MLIKAQRLPTKPIAMNDLRSQCDRSARITGLRLRGVGVLFGLLFVGSVQAVTADRELERRFERALTCRSDVVDPREPQTLDFLLSRGVKIDNLDAQGLPDFSFTFAKPLRILGTTVQLVRWAAGSGGIFYAEATGAMMLFVKKARAVAHPSARWEEDGYDRMPAQYARAMPKRADLDDFEPLWVIGQRTPGATFQWGCRYFDG